MIFSMKIFLQTQNKTKLKMKTWKTNEILYQTIKHRNVANPSTCKLATALLQLQPTASKSCKHLQENMAIFSTDKN